MTGLLLRCKAINIRRWFAFILLSMIVFMSLSFVFYKTPTNIGRRGVVDGGRQFMPQVNSQGCLNITVTKNECKSYQLHENEITQEFPLHFLSGAPGSGNDWIRWLATINRYTPYTHIPGKRKYAYAVYGIGHKLQPDASKVNTTHFMFFKSHEPWWHVYGRELSSYAKRAVLLLRHPFDACYSEYKRELLSGEQGKHKDDKKNAAVVVPLDVFIDVESDQLNPDWKSYLLNYSNKWVKHASYWLEEFDRPLHVLVYNYVREDTVHEIEDMQRFLGYNHNGPNHRRHCCVMADNMNPNLKRHKSAIDDHKEELFDKDERVTAKLREAVEQVHQMLVVKFPDKRYRVTRG